MHRHHHDHSNLLSEKEKKEIKEILNKKLVNKVSLVVLLDYKNSEEASEITEALLKEISKLNENLEIEFVDAYSNEGKELLEKYNLVFDKNQLGPIIFFKSKPNIVFLGFPLGMEFPVFLDTLEIISKNEVAINNNVAKNIAKVNSNLDVFVFVTATCPYCPLMTHPSTKFAFLNDKIRSIIVMSEMFSDLAQKHYVYAVPKTVIMKNSKIVEEIEGAIPEAAFAEKIKESSEN
ncbi:MAG: thioredoxin family protein [Candidatus Aenigmatarchaeota archaeon]